MTDTVTRPERSFVPEGFEITDWEVVEPYFKALQEREIPDRDSLQSWFKDRSELESILSEDLAWRYIRMTCDTTNKEAVEAYQDFIENIAPKAAPYSDQLNRKALDSPHIDDLDLPGYDVMIRSMKMEVKLFREENIPLQTEIQTKAQKFGQISGAMSIEHEGQELTMQQAAVLLQETDRMLRKRVYDSMSVRRLEDKDELNNLYSELIALRTKVAANAGYENFRDYMFDAMGRFDYKVEDCFAFHDSVEKEVVPLLDNLAARRKRELQVDNLRPWDKAVDTRGLAPLRPFNGGDDLLQRSIRTFEKLDPYLGERLTIMDKMGHLDLESRKGKAPGGYNYPLAETGVPFIFMNATSTLRDMVTLMHEGGHAVHSFLTKDLELGAFKHTPSEVAELASMSMELLSMDYWSEFFNEDELKRAKREHLEQIIETLPWVATIDKFQHWIYENPDHSVAEREEAWIRIFSAFSDTITDWSGLDEQRTNLWQKQLHLYEVPFYYIEYGMAQLGAIAIWKNYRENPLSGLANYIQALKLGYTATIPAIYSTAGIKFDFSRTYIHDLIQFVKTELEDLETGDQ